MFGYGIYDVLIIAGILLVQYILATRNSVYWGALIPLTFVAWRTWIFISGDEKFMVFALITGIGLLALIGGWYEGRQAIKLKRERELIKMKSADIK